MRRQTVAAAASGAGLVISIYLTVVHYSTIPVACPANALVNCEQVLSSPYGVIGGSGIPTSAAGILWFGVSAVVAAGLLAGRQVLAPIQLAWSALGLLTALFLVYLEIVLLGAVCIWCSAAHVLVLLIFLIALTRANAVRVRS
ncbi:MAG: vitamin K epoxide reductase family protein [Candidatus Dormibacteraceae bacterium]